MTGPAQSPVSLEAPQLMATKKKKKKKKHLPTQATRYGPETSRVPEFQEAKQGGGGCGAENIEGVQCPVVGVYPGLQAFVGDGVRKSRGQRLRAT